MNKTFAGLAAAAVVVLSACSATSAPSSSGSSPSSASASAGNGSSSAWYPQAVADSAMSDPNKPSHTFADTEAIGAAMGWKSVFEPGSTGVNSQGQEIFSPAAVTGEAGTEPGDMEEVFNEYTNGSTVGTQAFGTQQEVLTFPTAADEQAWIAQEETDSTTQGPLYLLAGKGWLLFDGDDTTDALAAQKVLGGSFLTLNNDQVVGFQ